MKKQKHDLIKEGLDTLKVLRKNGLEVSELCIHMECPDGEILELEIEIDPLTGDLVREYNRFENEDDYSFYLEHSEDNLEGIVYN